MGKEKWKYLAKATIVDTKESLGIIDSYKCKLLFSLNFCKMFCFKLHMFPSTQCILLLGKEILFTYFNRISTLFPIEEHQVEELLLSFWRSSIKKKWHQLLPKGDSLRKCVIFLSGSQWAQRKIRVGLKGCGIKDPVNA